MYCEFIHLVCFVLAGTAGLKMKLAKQINHMMSRLADCCCFSPLFLLAFLLSFPSFLLKLQLSRHKGPCGLDQMFQAAHFPTLCLMEYSWATRHHSTAQTRDHLFIYFITPLPACIMHNNSSPYKSVLSPSRFSSAPSYHFQCFPFLDRINKHVLVCIHFVFLTFPYPALDFSVFLLSFSCLSLSVLLGRWVGREESVE